MEFVQFHYDKKVTKLEGIKLVELKAEMLPHIKRLHKAATKTYRRIRRDFYDEMQTHAVLLCDIMKPDKILLGQTACQLQRPVF